MASSLLQTKTNVVPVADYGGVGPVWRTSYNSSIAAAPPTMALKPLPPPPVQLDLPSNAPALLWAQDRALLTRGIAAELATAITPI